MWKISKIYNNPMQNMVTIVNEDKSATPTTDYRAADKLARSVLGAASLNAKGYTALTGKPIRIYVSQSY